MKTKQVSSLFHSAMSDCAPGLFGVGLFSAMTNLLALTGSLYMLQIYDRVLPSQSIPTLVGLTAGMLGLYAAYGLLDLVRLRLLARIASRLYKNLHQRAFALSVLLPLKAGREADRLDPLRDVEHLRGFVAGSGPTVVFDAPWIPFYLMIIYMLHPALGVLATIGAVAVVAITALAEIFGRRPAKLTSEAMISQRALAESGRRNAEVVYAMGLLPRLAGRWSELVLGYLAHQERLSDIIGGTASLSKALRMSLQSCVLGLGAYLVIGGEASPGVIIASSILLGRALAPVDAAIANWKGFLSTRHSYFHLKATLEAFETAADPMELPPPHTQLTVDRLTVAPPGIPKPTVLDVSFRLTSGAGMAIVGPSGSGKTTLVRALVGAWTPLNGKVRLDGASLDQWNPRSLGSHIGYLPQDVELFDGTVADNISRFGGKSDPKGILAAARAAGIYSLIMSLPEGFQTRIGDGGRALSAGQRQLIGLARALYGDPFLVVLDEPNSNLDVEGDAALAGAILAVRQRGGIVIVVAHRPSALTNIDQVLVLADGMVRTFGSREEVLASIVRPPPSPAHRPSAVMPIRTGVSGHA